MQVPVVWEGRVGKRKISPRKNPHVINDTIYEFFQQNINDLMLEISLKLAKCSTTCYVRKKTHNAHARIVLKLVLHITNILEVLYTTHTTHISQMK